MNYTNINWHSNESHIFINPRIPHFEKNRLDKLIQKHNLQGHIFLSTSGSTAIESSDMKWVALKKSAFLISANSVNEHLFCSAKDVFLNTLPHFHVGGLALFARSMLCKGKIVDIYNENYKWNPQNFVQHLTTNKVTISSLVPTQVFDLVQNQLLAPPFLRAIVVGGGFLDKELCTQAQKLNWPLLPSYGMTECCSQIATAELTRFPFSLEWHSEYPMLTLLPHINLTLSPEGRIELSGESLLTGYIMQSQNEAKFIDPKVDGKIVTSDIGAFKNNKLVVYGRNDENVKINGENVSLIRLQSILQQVFGPKYDSVLIAIPDQRQGQKLIAVFHNKHENCLDQIESQLSKFNELVFPFERVTSTHFVDSIPRTELGKVKRNLLALSF